MAFPTLPSNGDTYTKDATIYTYDSASNSWSITGYEGVPASIYISSEDLDFSFSSTSGYSETEISTTYCVNIGSYIYCPVILYSNDFKFCVLYFTTDSTAFPVRVSTTYTGTISGYNIISQYVDGGVIYLNDSSGKYHTFDTSDNSFTTNNTGSYTSGTQITSALQLNGFQYDTFGKINNLSGNAFGNIKTKVTKI